MGRPWLIAMAGIVLFIATSLSASDQVNVFETYRCWTVHLRVSAKQWAMMEPTRAPRLAFLLGIERSEFPSTQPASAQAPEDEAIEGRRLEPNAFGYEYAYVRATVKFDNEVVV
ncbi:MAG TPA: hypothetical protein VHP11_17085, partial [Tepidisphaeraceae bacterium]|nr:hypothetical protein [Tepidisphaeraceae bacterium]